MMAVQFTTSCSYAVVHSEFQILIDVGVLTENPCEELSRI